VLLPLQLAISACEDNVTAKRLCTCLLGSTLLHIAMFILITKMTPTTHVAMPEIEAFIIEPPVAQLPEPKRPIPLCSGTNTHRHALETGQLLPVRHGDGSAAPLAVQNVGMKTSPSNEAPISTALQSAQSLAPASLVLNTAPISPLSARSQEEIPGGKLSIPSRQNSGTGQDMVLGDVGSPRFIHRESPIYPFMARKLGKEGKVVLRLALDAQGRLQGIDVVEANGFGFAEAASSAIRKSTFAPAIRDGRTISSRVLVPSGLS
jgi:TonB family protein